MSNSGYEKRKHLRVNTIVKVDVFNYYSGKFISSGYITDIGIGGLRIEANEHINDEDDVLLKFILTNGHFFENLRGRIIRTGKESFTYFYGIKFIDVSLRDRVRLWFFSKKMEKKGYI